MTSPMPPPPPPPSPGPAGGPKAGGKAGIWIGIVLVIVGMVGGVVLIVSGVRSPVTGVAELERVPVGGGSMEIEEAGTVTVYGERGVPGSAPKTFSSSTSGGPVPEIDVSIVGPGGEAIAIEPVAGSEEYQSDGHWGTRIGRFEANRAGTYTVAVVGGTDVRRYDTIAVGDVDPQGVWLIVAGVLGGGFVAVVGLVLVIVSAIRRGRAIRRARQGSWPDPGAPGPPPPPSGWPVAPT